MVSETWRQLSLGEVATLQRGYDLPHKERKSGTVPVISSSGSIDTHNESRAAGPGVVTGRYGTIGEVFFVSEDFWPLNTTLFVKDFKGNDPLFISFLLRTIDYHSYSGKSGVPGVNRNDLHEIGVSLPPLPEQRAIATALSDVDALIASLDRLIAKKRDIKQATMQQLLTGKMRLPGFSGELKPGYKQTEVGVIPEDWDVLSLGELATTVASGKSKAKSTHGTYPVHGSTGVIGYAESAEYEGNALLVARVGANAGKLINVTGRFGVTDNTIIVRLKAGSWLPFFWQQLETKRLNSLVFGSGQPLITGTQLKSLLLCVPPSNEQKAIATVLSDMDAEITALEEKRDKTRALKQGMMQELLTGKTRLV
jgi:type I restriction enzyme S subunit